MQIHRIAGYGTTRDSAIMTIGVSMIAATSDPHPRCRRAARQLARHVVAREDAKHVPEQEDQHQGSPQSREDDPHVDHRSHAPFYWRRSCCARSHVYDDLAARVSLVQVREGARGLAQRIRAVDDRRDLAGLDELVEREQALRVRSWPSKTEPDLPRRTSTRWLPRSPSPCRRGRCSGRAARRA